MKEWGEAGIFSQMTLFVEETCRLFQYGMEWEDCLQTMARPGRSAQELSTGLWPVSLLGLCVS